MADRLKNLLLILLLALMAALLVLTFSVSVRGGARGRQLLQPQDEGDGFLTDVPLQALAKPEVFALLLQEGVYLADTAEEYDRLYRQAEPLLQEAVGSAGPLTPLNEQHYLDRLSGRGVLLQFHDAQPWHLLQSWGGSETLEAGTMVRSAAMIAAEEQVLLLLTDHTGARWQAETAASFSELETICASGGAVNARLALEDPALSGDEVLTTGVGRYTGLALLPPETVTKGELAQSIQSLFGMNAYLTRVYQNTDGSLVYVESHNTVSLTPKGDLTYVGAQGIDLELTGTGPARENDLCQKVYALVELLWEQAGAAGQLSLQEIQLEQDTGLLRFALHDNGRFLERKEGSWATVTVQDGTVTGLTAALRLLVPEGEVQLLPGYQAAAVLPRGKAALRLRLMEQAEGVAVPQLCRVSEE